MCARTVSGGGGKIEAKEEDEFLQLDNKNIKAFFPASTCLCRILYGTCRRKARVTDASDDDALFCCKPAR